MITTTQKIGPGPTSIYNEWLNFTQNVVWSNSEVVHTFGSGVVKGCKVTFVPGREEQDASGEWTVFPPKIEVGAGEVIADGMYYEIAAKTWEMLFVIDTPFKALWVSREDVSDENWEDLHGESPPALTLGLPEAVAGDNVWVYVDQSGELQLQTSTLVSSESWPSNGDANAKRYLPVLAFTDGIDEVSVTEMPAPDAPYNNYYPWDSTHDIRHFVREKPNGAYLVVGDPDTGADFPNIQQALDYLESCDKGDNDVSRRILVTKSQVIDTPLKVRCPGVTIEGVKNEVADAAERITLSWSYCSARSNAAQGALIDVAGYVDVGLFNLHFVHASEQGDVKNTWCCIHNPGNRFRLEGCIFGQPESHGTGTDPGSTISVAVDFGSGVVEGARLAGNKAFGMIRGLTGFPKSNAQYSMGCLKRAAVQDNYVSVADLKEIRPPDSGPNEEDECEIICFGEEGSPTEEELLTSFFAIDMGFNPDECLYNRIEHNVLERPLCGIRVGGLSAVNANAIRGCYGFGIYATAWGSLDLPDAAGFSAWLTAWDKLPGATDIAGNYVDLGPFPNQWWWRAAIRLEMPGCHVAHNTIIVGQNSGCGIVQGPLPTYDKAHVAAHFASLLPGKHSVVGNNINMAPINDDGTVNHAAQITRQGIGIALFSTHNRVTDNGIFHARTGIVVTAYNSVVGNIITPAAVAILAWAYNSVAGNVIGWFPHVQDGLPWTLHRFKQKPLENYGAILVSIGNALDSNTIVCGSDAPYAANRPAAIHIDDWPMQIFGPRWFFFFAGKVWSKSSWDNVPAHAAKLLGKRVGGNTISHHRISLYNPIGYWSKIGIPISALAVTIIALVLARFRDWLQGVQAIIATAISIILKDAYLRVDGIVFKGSWDGNIVTGTQIWHGIRAIDVKSGHAMIDGCMINRPFETGIHIKNSISSKVSGCTVVTFGRLGARLSGLPVYIDKSAPGTTVNDCVLWQSFQAREGNWSLREKNGFAPLDIMYHAPCMVQKADNVSVNDCTIVNYANMGIYWAGNNGQCGGCWFYTRSDLAQTPQGEVFCNNTYDYGWETSNYLETGLSKRYPAIFFAYKLEKISYDYEYTTGAGSNELSLEAKLPVPATGGNLVWGAHMLNCQPSGRYYHFGMASPIKYVNDLPQMYFPGNDEHPKSSPMWKALNWLMNPNPPMYVPPFVLWLDPEMTDEQILLQARCTNLIHLNSCYWIVCHEPSPVI
ncbi:MAG: hypothetical protein GY854_04450 [Deltaproteobacteria bacterium]|nr:hypothetical protein [Deltaproteobacteria bacterium]